MAFCNLLKQKLRRLRAGLRSGYPISGYPISGDPMERYLAQSDDLYDLEFRMQQVNRGEAPFQVHSRPLITAQSSRRQM